MRRSICVMFALLMCLAVFSVVSVTAEADDNWIEEQLREIEEYYNPEIMPLSFVEGHIPWETYFTVSGLPATVSKEQWLRDCAVISSQGYTVDNTGVKYTKFPQYNTEGYHFVNVTVNDVEVVRLGILVPDDDPSAPPVYYYLTQKHVDSDETNDGSGSHTGAISALLLPKDAQIQVNYAANEYQLSYEIQLKNSDGVFVTVTDDNSPVKDVNGNVLTWEYAIFAGQNAASTTGGAASFSVTIPYGYTATVWQQKWNDKTDEWEDELELTGNRTDGHEVNEGYPLGKEPEYETYKSGNDTYMRLKSNSPSTKTMSAVFNSDIITENRHIIVKLVKDKDGPIFDASVWVQTINASGRGSTGEDKGWDGSSDKGGNIQTADGWDWKNNPAKSKGAMKQESDGTYSYIWTFQTNLGEGNNYIMDSLALNGVDLAIPYTPATTSIDQKDVQYNEDIIHAAGTYTVTTLPDGATAELRLIRAFGDNTKTQRVYTLIITGARSDVVVTGGNILTGAGAPEYIPSTLIGVTAEENSATIAIYVNRAWEVRPLSLPIINKDSILNGSYDENGFNVRFKLMDGYENPVFSWTQALQGNALLAGSSKKKEDERVLPLSSLNGKTPDVDTIYKDDDGWYYIRLETLPTSGQNKILSLSITATAMKYMVRYMVGTEGDPDTNAPSEAKGNVQGMPEFSTDDSSWDDGLADGIAGNYPERYDDNGGNFYDLQAWPKIPISAAQPTTKDGTKFFQYWVLVDSDENVVKDSNGNPVIIQPNGTINLSEFVDDAVSLNSQIGGTDSNYYVIRLKGVWSDLPTDFKFYIRMVWTDENGKTHIMDLVQNVVTSSTDPNLVGDCLIVTVNTVTDTFQDWFKAHPFYAYAPRNFIATAEREDNQFRDENGNLWEAYPDPDQFTVGSTEQGLNNPNRYYRVEVDEQGIVRYFVQREGTIILYLDEVNGKLPLAKSVIGSDPGADEFTYTVTVKLLASDIARAGLEPGDPNYLTPESLKNILPSGTYFGFAPSADMTDLSAFTGRDVELHFRRSAVGSRMEDWYSTATFTLKGGEATVLSVPQGSYTITEKADGTKYTVTVETDGKVTRNAKTISDKVVEAGKTASAVKFTNEVEPAEVEGIPRVSTEITGKNLPAGLAATFGYTLRLVSGDGNQVKYTSEGSTLETTGPVVDGTPFDGITFKHTGTYQFLVTETLQSCAAGYEDTILPGTSTRALTIVVENIDGKLMVTKITVDGTVYAGDEGDYALEKAVVPFVHSYVPIVPDAVRVIPTVYKKLKGRELLSAAFTFEMQREGETITYTATNNAAANGERGAVNFPAIDFDVPGVYTVTIREKIPDDNGAADRIAYDDRAITITYTVENVEGELQVTESYADDKDTFENQAYADASITVIKNYDLSLRPGGRWGDDTFTVTATLTGAPAGAEVGFDSGVITLNGTAEITLTENEKNSGKDFGFHFTEEGVYTFEVREKNENRPGVSYDNSVYYVTVEVTAESKSLTASLSIVKNNKAVAGTVVTFDNKYAPERVDVAVNASKILQDINGNRVGLTAERFRFELAPTGQTTGSTLTAKNDANGNVTFTLQNLSPGTYTYRLREVDDGESGVTYDPRECAVTVIVELLPGNSAVTYTVLYDDEETVPTFTNTISGFGQLIVSNEVTGDNADPNKEFTYTFTFGGTSGAFRYELRSSTSSYGLFENLIMPLFAPESTAVTGTISSGGSIQLRDGQSVIIYGLPVGTSYRVVESEYDNYLVSHDGTEGDTASGIIGSGDTVVNYKNSLAIVAAAVPEITKTLTGRGLQPGEFAFAISCDPMDGVTLPGVAVNDADGKVRFGPVTFTKRGTYQVTVKEVIPTDATNNTKNGVTYDTHALELTYVVTDDEHGGLTVTGPTVSGEGGENAKTFNNTVISSGQLIVSKQVTGNAGDLQAEFAFMILLSDTSISGTYGDVAFSNGVATFTLKHGESKTASGLPAGTRYSVQEQSANQDGYATVSTGESGIITAGTTMTAVFVNAKDVADIPQTGDNSHIEAWLVMALAALVSMICCLSIKRRQMGVRK